MHTYNSSPRVLSFSVYVLLLLFILGVPGPASSFAASKVPKVKLSVKPLDLDNVTARDIMAAGQLGGQLYPTEDIVNPESLSGMSEEKKNELKKMNRDFAEAIQEWNKHNYKQAAVMFRGIIKNTPDSPWADEAILHLGCDAQYNGRYAEAEEHFLAIIDRNSVKEFDGAHRLSNKARLRLGVLKVAQNNFGQAKQNFADLISSSDDWRERTYSSHWIQRLNRYQADSEAMLNCGYLALAELLRADGRVAEARELSAMKPESDSGQTMLELRDLAAGYGYELVGLNISVSDIAGITLPAVVQLSGRGTGDSGHYWVLEKVEGNMVKLHDPQSKRRFSHTLEEFGGEWGGNVLVFRQGGAAPAVGRELSDEELGMFCGGCCGIPRCEENLGYSSGLVTMKQLSAALGLDAKVNMINLNLLVSKTPIVNKSPVGPSVGVTLTYNSESAIAYNDQLFGNKWQFNYYSYLVVDTGGQVTVFRPDGGREVYTPDGEGGYENQLGVYNTLTRNAENDFELKTLDETVYAFQIPAGTNSLQPFLVSITDIYGHQLTIGYDDQVRPVAITDDMTETTTITYDVAYGTGGTVTVTGPHGRTAIFEIDAANNLVKITDMGGYETAFAYDQDNYLTSVSNPRVAECVFNINVEPADGTYNGADAYPPPGGVMWENVRITVENPLNGKDEYYYNGKGPYGWHVKPNHYKEYENSQYSNLSDDVPKTRFFYTVVSDQGRVSMVDFPSGGRLEFGYDPEVGKPSYVADYHGKDNDGLPINHVVKYKYTDKGLFANISTARRGGINYTYANGIDLTKKVLETIPGKGDGNIPEDMTYYDKHLLRTKKDPVGNITTYVYNSDGQIEKVTDALNKYSTYNYAGKRLQSITRDVNNVIISSYTYDTYGRVRTETGPAGVTLTYDYDSLDRLTRTTLPDGTYTETAYSPDMPGLTASVTDRTGYVTKNEYDVFGRLVRVIRADGTVVSYGYDANGNRTSLTDTKGNTTTFTYDSSDRLKEKKYADGKGEKYEYDVAGLMTQKTNARNKVIKYEYDENHNNTLVDYTSSTDVTFTYDSFNRVTSRVDGIGTYDFTYYKTSNVYKTFGPWQTGKDELIYHYDALNRLNRLERKNDGGNMQSINYGYDDFGRLESVDHAGSRVFNYGYEPGTANPLPVSLSLPNGTVTSYGYDDPLKRLRSVTNNATTGMLNSFEFSYTDASSKDIGVVTSETITNGAPLDVFNAENTDYTYNNLNQLTHTDNPNKDYTYDEDGNMKAGRAPSGNALGSMSYDDENRLTSIIRWESTYDYKWDFRYSGDGFLAEEIRYSSPHNTYTWTEIDHTMYVRSGEKVIVELDYDGNNYKVKRRYIWGLNAGGGIGGLLEKEDVSGSNGTRYYPLYDGKGNVVTVLDSSQNVVASYSYDVFGRVMSETGTLDMPYRFSTKRYYPQLGMSYFGYRFYVPEIGRWVTRDPKGEEGGLNLYGFVGNSPVSYVDPLGLEMDKVSFLGSIAGVAAGGADFVLSGGKSPFVAFVGYNLWYLGMLNNTENDSNNATSILLSAGEIGLALKFSGTFSLAVATFSLSYSATNLAIERGWIDPIGTVEFWYNVYDWDKGLINPIDTLEYWYNPYKYDNDFENLQSPEIVFEDGYIVFEDGYNDYNCISP